MIRLSPYSAALALVGLLVFGVCRPVYAQAQTSSAASLQADCDSGKLEACVKAGSILYAKGEDLFGARKAYQTGCEGNLAEACLNLGVMVAAGDGGREDDRSARGIYDKACSLNLAAGCYNSAQLQLRGEGGAVDIRAARQGFDTACQRGLAQACRDLGLTLNRTDAGLPSPEGALLAFAKACDGGEPEGCLYLGLMREDGRGAPADPVAARRAFEAACQGRSGGGCYQLGHALELGESGPKDLVAARKAYQSGCQVDQADACLALVALVQQGQGGGKDAKLARTLFQKYCAPGELAACEDLGKRYFPDLLKLNAPLGADGAPVNIIWPSKGTTTSQEAELGRLLDYLIDMDSRYWLMRGYMVGSVFNVEILNESKDKSSGLVFANFFYTDGSSAWVKARIGKGGVSCLEFDDLAGQCRPIGANPAVGMAMMAFVSALLEPPCQDYVREGLFSDEIVTIC